ncbi:Trifunctional purine biosynthetic protein adenosine-3 [Fragariocoptes setiger]|uniref:Trifunctional purine biosynthetic protein adenosine-3 n=1 Tax=Fragariocoptes setiger TaxID=1670756 RepID=A0ABQ7SCA1_9ACAR|nr:Trifunctional purine biosynthetic protein adenosine-3 [Fragariocoptes setiger]
MTKEVLVIGGGAREHAITLKLLHSPIISKIYVAPGNPGMYLAEPKRVILLGIDVSNVNNIIEWCKTKRPDMVVVGPEDPLNKGVAEKLAVIGVTCFGPSSRAARIECDKSYAKDFMVRHNIPTAQYRSFTSSKEAKHYVMNETNFQSGYVVKASGLAAGKGTLIAKTKQEACEHIETCLDRKVFGDAGTTTVVEEFLEGEECSVLAFTDGVNVSLMPAAQDHKRAYDNDFGPNTGGMGAICPFDLVESDSQLREQIKREIIDRAIKGMHDDGHAFVGVLFAGVMLTPLPSSFSASNKGGRPQYRISTLEYNCRFGDPETQSILPLLETDLFQILLACVSGRLNTIEIKWKLDVFTCGIVIADAGYPETSITKGQLIEGLERANTADEYSLAAPAAASNDDDDHRIAFVIHAGTKFKDDQRRDIVTNGGRILTVVGVGHSLESAVEKALRHVRTIRIAKSRFRSDLGRRQIARAQIQLTYKSSGVDIEKGNRFVDHVKEAVKVTFRDGVMSQIGAFGAFFDLSSCGYLDPILVSSTDGVGTKLKLAIETGLYADVGIDLVAMCVNDILVHGAEPLFFLDYFACGHLELSVAKKVIESIAFGCTQANCALIGGETAELPGLYQGIDIDLAGFAVGAVSRHKILPRMSEIRAGDTIIGLASNGVHSNGYSLVRKIIKLKRIDICARGSCKFDKSFSNLAEALLTPTQIYVQQMITIIKADLMKAAAHITGGGLLENIPRSLPKNLCAKIDAKKWPILPVFKWIRDQANVDLKEMIRTFNCGLGMICIVAREDLERTMRLLAANSTVGVYHVGELIERIALNGSQCIVDNLDDAFISGPAYLSRDHHYTAATTPPSTDSVETKESSIDGTTTTLSTATMTETLQKPSKSLSSGSNNSNNKNKTPLKKVNHKEHKKVAILLSGTGTNAKSIIEHEKQYELSEGSCPYRVCLVVSNVTDALGLEYARQANIETCVISHKDYKTRLEFDMQISRTLKQKGIDLVCLAGFMRILTPEFVNEWAGRLINIHPSLLPAFKGMDAYKRAIEAGVRLTGCTVHFVNEHVDDGAIILQEPIMLLPDDTVHSLVERGKRIENKTYPRAVYMLTKGLVKLDIATNKLVWKPTS